MHKWRLEMFPSLLAGLITGSVKQMKAKNKWRLYFVGADCVTVSSCFILGERVHPKLDPHAEATAAAAAIS